MSSPWKKFLAVGCSHGNWADPSALKTVLRFKDSYKPDTVIHLGDYCDMTAFRSGATVIDEQADVQDDLTSGINFLTALEPDIIFDGNHDVRVHKLAEHPNSKIRFAAKSAVEQINDLVKKLHAKHVPYDIEKGWLKLGDTLFGHGFMFNETALRDHAEAFGKCAIAHLHTPGMANGRRLDNPVAYCAGYLGDRDKFTYANTNKSKLRWNQGFLWGEYSSKCTVIRLEQKASNGSWRLPL